MHEQTQVLNFHVFLIQSFLFDSFGLISAILDTHKTGFIQWCECFNVGLCL